MSKQKKTQLSNRSFKLGRSRNGIIYFCAPCAHLPVNGPYPSSYQFYILMYASCADHTQFIKD